LYEADRVRITSRQLTVRGERTGEAAWFGDLAVVGLLALATGLMFITAPQHGDFWWSDTSRHALNGVFVRDFLADLPLRDPVGYATSYYLRYPALTILFYPPLFYLLSAPFYALFGVSHAVALMPELLGYFAFGVGSYMLARRWLDQAPACGAALLLIGSPIVGLWGRQVMLDIPACALLSWAIWCLYRHLDTRRPGPLYGFALLLLGALYTKQTLLFMGLPLALLLVCYRGRALLADRQLWIAGGVVAVGLVPLAILLWQFGQANLQSVVAVDDRLVERNSLSGWLWYLSTLPEQLGWPTLALAAIGLAGMALWRAWRIPARDIAFLGAWFIAGYAFFSAMDLKDSRFSIPMLFPVVVLAALPFDRLGGGPLARGPLARLTAVAAGIAVLALTLRYHPVPQIDGYQTAVDIVAQRAPKDSAVLFSGYRDGNFIFDLRARGDRPDLRVLRADKLLLRYAIRRELGVEQKGYSEDQIADLLGRYGVGYVVAQTGFWDDLAEMRRFESLLRSGRFEEVARVPVTGNVPHDDRELVIYRTRGPVAPPGETIQLDLPVIGRTIKGKVD
jgi:4-amino-4-deoxy-L-arabinose transferase-like glycosyltransferase